MCLSLFIGGSIYAAKRSDRPVQLQYALFSGAAVGYHFNDYAYVGTIQIAESESTYDEIFKSDNSTHYDQIDIESASIKQEPKQAVEIRLTPWDWDFGVHFSLGYLIQGKIEKEILRDERYSPGLGYFTIGYNF